MGDPIINTQVDAINATLGNIKVDLAALRPSIRAIKDAIAETYLTDTIENVSIASFNDGADEIPVRELEVAINPIQSGTGDPSPTNIRPISGWSAVNIWDDPKHAQRIVDWNQLINADGTGWVLSRVSVTAAGSKLTFAVTDSSSIKFAYRNVIKGHKYYYSGTFDSSSNYGFAIGIWNGNSNNNYTDRHLYSYTGETVRFAHISESVNDNQTFRLQFATTSTTTAYSIVENFMLCDLTEMFGAGNEPATVEAFEALFPKDYYPYNAGENLCVSSVNGDPYTKQTISLGQTVYGGTLNVTTRELTITHKSIDLGDDTWTAYGNADYGGLFYTDDVQSEIKHASNNDVYTMCSSYLSVPNKWSGQIGSTAEMPNNSLRVKTSDGRIYIRDDAHISDTGATFKTAMSGVQLVYELATPITVQLTAAEIETLFGQNNIWADSGNVVKLIYRKAWEIALAQGE